MRASWPMASATVWTSAPVSSQMRAIALMKLIWCQERVGRVLDELGGAHVVAT